MKQTICWIIACSALSISASAWCAVSAPGIAAPGIAIRKVTPAQARDIATRVAAGTLEDHEYEQEAGAWRYSFDFRQADGRIHEIGVDAQTGKVVEDSWEAAADKDQTPR